MAADRRPDPASVRTRLRRASGTIRVRTTAAALLIVGVAMAVGAIALVAVLRTALTREVARRGAGAGPGHRRRAGGRRPAPGAWRSVPPRTRWSRSSTPEAPWSPRVQTSPPARRRSPPCVRASPPRSRVPVDDDPYLAVAVGATAGGERYTVLVARSVEPVGRPSGIVTALLAAGLPALLAVVGTTTWLVVGRTLAPAEAIRAEVDAISAADLSRRVPDTGGTDEVARLGRTMNRMLDRLELAQTRERQLVSDASHELRSPVAALRQHAEVALAHPDLSDARARRHRVGGERAPAEPGGGPAAAGPADEDSLRLSRRPVDLDDLVLDEARRLRAGPGAPRVDASAVSAGRVTGDAGALRRVLRNLVDNAARHARSKVGLALAEVDGEVLLAVEDDGPGIPPDQRERVLERFVRLDDARTRDAGGSGLGLAIVAEVVAAHGGTVAVGDAAGGGARIEIRLPRS